MPKNHVSRNKADLSEIINILNHRKNKIQIRVIEANTEVLLVSGAISEGCIGR